MDVVASPPERTVTVLVIGEPGIDRDSLRSILSHSNWIVYDAASSAGALEVLSQHRIAVVLCGCTLPDGDWKTVLELLSGMLHPPPLIVTSQSADDRLWAEVLNLGGYDLLPAPFDPREVIRVTGVAWLHWKDLFSGKQLAAAGCS